MDHYKAYMVKDHLSPKSKSAEQTKAEMLTKELQKKIKLIEKAFR